jgi:hypothetical protein
MACEGEDDSIKPAENYLVGNWELIEVGTLNSSNILVYTSLVPEGSCGFDTMAFSENNVLTVTEYSSDTEIGCESYIDSGSYALDVLNLDLVFVPEGETEPTMINGTIETLSLTNMVLTYSEEGDIFFLKFRKL